MKQARPFTIAVVLCAIAQIGFAQKSMTETQKDLHAAVTTMFAKVVQHDPSYFKNYVTNDFFSINADGVTADKAETLADSARGKMLAACTYKSFDENIRVYGTTGIVTGRTQAFMNGAMIVEFLHTAIFVNQNGKWMYAGWQGTISKNSPPPPPMPAQ